MRSTTLRGRRRLACQVAGMGGCGSLSVPTDGAEARVLELVVAELDSDDFARAVDAALAAAPDTELADVAVQLAADRTQLGVLADAFADGYITRDTYKRAVGRLDGRIADAETALARAAAQSGPAVELVGRGDAVRAMWERPRGRERLLLRGAARRHGAPSPSTSSSAPPRRATAQGPASTPSASRSFAASGPDSSWGSYHLTAGPLLRHAPKDGARSVPSSPARR
jgi:hypothetical protein